MSTKRIQARARRSRPLQGVHLAAAEGTARRYRRGQRRVRPWALDPGAKPRWQRRHAEAGRPVEGALPNRPHPPAAPIDPAQAAFATTARGPCGVPIWRPIRSTQFPRSGFDQAVLLRAERAPNAIRCSAQPWLPPHAPHRFAQGPLTSRAIVFLTHYEMPQRPTRIRCPPGCSLLLSLGYGLERQGAYPGPAPGRISANGRITQLTYSSPVPFEEPAGGLVPVAAEAP